MKPEPEIMECVCPHAFGETVSRLSKAIVSVGMMIFSRIDYAAGAREVGLSMPPSLVLVYGYPRGGTPVLQACPLAALDLPLRVLVHEAQREP